jgi:hypothetical protein
MVPLSRKPSLQWLIESGPKIACPVFEITLFSSWFQMSSYAPNNLQSTICFLGISYSLLLFVSFNTNPLLSIFVN